MDFQEFLQKVSRKQGLLRNKIFGSPLGRKKVFGIGLNKTGTSTLGACFRTLGLAHLYNVHKLSKLYFQGDFEGIFQVTDQHDSFEDWPHPLMYQELFNHYGKDALFVLTLRKSTDVWLKSLSKHAKRINSDAAQQLRTSIYGYADPDGHEAEHIKFYNDHTQAVIQFFEDNDARDQLQIICWEDGHGWDELCGFLGLRKPWVSFPHVNRATS